MIWRFTIYDRYNNATVIDEPVGWDANVAEIKRDPDYHGIFFNNQGETFEFDGKALRLLKDEYDLYGAEGIMYLIEEEDCGSGYVEFSRSKFLFTKYKLVEDVVQFVKIPLENRNEVMDLRNRINQKVNLDTLIAFDETTALPAYSKLGFEMELPSKGILIQDYFKNENINATPVKGVPLNNSGGPADFNSEYGMIEIPFDKQVATEIGNAGTQLQPLYSCVFTTAGNLGCNSIGSFTMAGSTNQIFPPQITSFVNYQEGSNNYNQVSNPVNLDFIINGNIIFTGSSGNEIWFVLAVLPKGKSGENDTDYIYYQKNLIGTNFSNGIPVLLNTSYSNNNFLLEKGDMVFCFYSIYHRRQNSSISAGADAFTLSFDAGNYFKLTNLSHTDPTISKVYMVNESISRVAEVITNDKLRAYTEYFGRTDSQPYSHAADGCGGLEVLTDGIRIRRQENKIPGKTNLFSLSLQDLFEGLNPIHNIGMGLEPDTARAGFNRLRIEPWHFFYNTMPLMSCTGINKITRECYDKEIYSTFQFGYSKWEAEQYNGLDEFLTKRNFRTILSQIKNDFIKLSKLIASGYALEVTRRIGENDSKDWRYDKENFIICVSRTAKFKVKFDPAIPGFYFDYTGDISIFTAPTIDVANSLFNNGTFSVFSYSFVGTKVTVTVSGGVITAEESYGIIFPSITFPADKVYVELGNVINSVNIIDPSTIYNWRIRPVYNAMRWMNKVLKSYKQFNANAKIIFTDGDGNYFAEGEMQDAFCKLENAAIAENATINKDVFDDADFAKPFSVAERVVYEYPMNSDDYKNIEANPYGLIYFESDCEQGYGWIDTINYKKEEGIATFNLIPKAN